MQSLNGQFFIMAVNWKGEGTVLQSPTPWLGDNTFQQISGTFQGRLLLNTSPGVVSITNGQFNDVVFTNP